LRRLLQEQPQATAQQVINWLDYAFDSTDPFPLKPGFRLSEFGRHYAKYVRGPFLKDRPGAGSNGHPSGETNAPTQAELTATDREIYRKYGVEVDG